MFLLYCTTISISDLINQRTVRLLRSHTLTSSSNFSPLRPSLNIPQTNAFYLLNVYLTLSTAYELAITKSIWQPLIVRQGAWRDVYGDPLIFQPDGALIYSIDLTLRQRSPRHNPPD